MTQEQYNRAVEINHMIKGLGNLKKRMVAFYKLWYAERDNNGGYHLCDDIECIRDILDRHDKMIREEIDSEIEKLKKEIEKL